MFFGRSSTTFPPSSSSSNLTSSPNNDSTTTTETTPRSSPPSTPPLTPPPPPPPTADATVDPDARSELFSRRSRQQLSFFFLGASAIWLSGIVTRRAIARRYRSVVPAYFQPSNAPRTVEGSSEAAAALGIATMYVGSVGATFVAGLLWALDLSSVEEMRLKFRRHAGIPLDWDRKPPPGSSGAGGDTRDQAEREIEEWVAETLARKELRLFGGKDLLDKVRAELEKERAAGRAETDGGGGSAAEVENARPSEASRTTR